MVHRVYIAGPMRGIPLFNFPAFDAEAARLRAIGYEVVSPAEMDRQHGFDESEPPEITMAFMRSAIMRDLQAIAKCDAIVCLPGWERSAGVAVEIALARFLNLPVYDANLEEICPR